MLAVEGVAVSACAWQHRWLSWVLSHADVTITPALHSAAPEGDLCTIPDCAGPTFCSALHDRVSHRRPVLQHILRLNAHPYFLGRDRHQKKWKTQLNKGERCMWRVWITLSSNSYSSPYTLIVWVAQMPVLSTHISVSCALFIFIGIRKSLKNCILIIYFTLFNSMLQNFSARIIWRHRYEQVVFPFLFPIIQIDVICL